MSPPPDKRYLIALGALEAGLLDAAEQELQSILDDQPDDGRAHQLLAAVKLRQGTVELQRGNFDVAIETLSTALEITPEEPDGWSNLGLAYQDAGAPERAEDCFRKALMYVPHHLGALNNLGLLLAGQGCFAAAQALFDQAIAIDPMAEPARVHRAVAQLEQGDVIGARQSLDAVPQLLQSSTALQDVRAYAEVYISDNAVDIAQAQVSSPASAPRPALQWDGRRPPACWICLC